MSLIAFHDKSETKQFYIDRMKQHMAMDELIQGEGWDGQRGCAVGCTLDNYDHEAYESELGWPVWLAKLEDGLFEGQTADDAKQFPLALIEAVPIGFTTEQFTIVKSKFFHWLLVDKEYGVIRFALKDDQQKAISDVAALHDQIINGQTVTDKASAAASAAAWDAAWDAAWAAASAAARDAASAAASAAHYKAMADKLVSLFKQAGSDC